MNEHRRAIVRALAAAGALGVGGRIASVSAAEPPLETTRVRLVKFPSLCQAPIYVAGELLRADGFDEVTYVDVSPVGTGPGSVHLVGEGGADMGLLFAAPLVMALDRGANVTVIGGAHPGCFELFTTPDIRSVKDLKGKTVSVLGNESSQHVFLASIVNYVGLDPQKDIRWDFNPPAKGKQLLAEGKVDAYLGFPPDPQELRDRKIGRMLLSSTTDRPWSQYFCCMVAANRDWGRKNPVATKRVLRAILKANDICASNPEAAVKAYMSQGHTPNLEFGVRAIRELPYRRWRDFNPEDSLRFFGLQLREAGMVKNAPQKIVAQGTDWRILEELKRELKS